MTLPLSIEMLESAYDYFRATPPFRRWNLPEPEDITFKVGKDPSCYGWFDKKKKKPTIAISTALVGHTQTLMETMAHEMIHLHEDMRGWRRGGEHSAAFRKWAQLVCKIHGFDPKGF